MREKIFEQLEHYAIILMYTLMGISAKLASINKHKKITKAQALSTVASGVLCGFLANSVCDYYQAQNSLRVVSISISALAGENITGWILVNAKDLITQMVQIIFKQKK